MILDYKKIKRIIPQERQRHFQGYRDTVVSYEIECTFNKHGEIEIPFLSLYKYYTRQHVLEDQREALFEKVKKEKSRDFRRELIDPEISEIFFRECHLRSNPHYACTVVKMILPFLEKPTNYFWKETKQILMLTISQACIDEKIQDYKSAHALSRWVSLLLFFVSNVFEAKWQVGLENCLKDPDPGNFSYPRTERFYRIYKTWEEEIFWPNLETLAKELGLKTLLYDEKEFVGTEKEPDLDQKRALQQEIEQWTREREIFYEEMRKRGLSPELFYQQNWSRFPEKGEYQNLDQVLRKEIDLYEQGRITEESLYSKAENTLFKVWDDCYGPAALVREFMEDFKTYTYQHKFFLNAFYDFRLQEDPAEIYRMVSKIESILHVFIRKTLEAHFGEQDDVWWVMGVPANIRVRCQTAREQDSERFDPFAYTFLIELKEIILKNWEVFKPYFEDTQKRSLKKEKQIKWIDRLNHLRNLVMHSVKRPLTPDEVRFISDCLERVKILRRDK